MFDEAGVGLISETVSDLTQAISATALATKFADHFLPICQASVDLLEADELRARDGRGGALATLIADETRRAPDALFPLPMPADKRLQKLCDTLLGAPALTLDIDEWAETVGISRRTMTRRFRAETGLSFADWRRRLRALRALTQQAEGAPPQVAAKANGYASAAALQAMIKRTTGEARVSS